jgi:hypothetical protein
MSDMRFIVIGIGFIFSGFLILGVFGHTYQTSNIETSEFGDCYEYHENKEPNTINCSAKIFDQVVFFGIVLILIATGIISLIKGAKGRWDNEVRPEDMTGPSQ